VITPINERALSFTFSSPWKQAVKWDDTEFYRKRVQKLEGTDAVDIVAQEDDKLLFVEVKDYRWPTTTPDRFGVDLAQKIAEKVRDTVAGLVGASRMAGEGAKGTDWRAVGKQLADEKLPLFVVLWFETGAYYKSSDSRKKALSDMAQLIKVRLAWLTTKVFVYDLADGHNLPGLKVVSLPKPIN
jgi:hypothetical protein